MYTSIPFGHARPRRTRPDRRAPGKAPVEGDQGAADSLDLTLGDLIEGVLLHALDGKAPFSAATWPAPRSSRRSSASTSTAADAHHLTERPARTQRTGAGATPSLRPRRTLRRGFRDGTWHRRTSITATTCAWRGSTCASTASRRRSRVHRRPARLRRGQGRAGPVPRDDHRGLPGRSPSGCAPPPRRPWEAFAAAHRATCCGGSRRCSTATTRPERLWSDDARASVPAARSRAGALVPRHGLTVLLVRRPSRGG